MINEPTMHYIYQPSTEADAPTLLLLHGTGGDEHDLLSLVPYFGNNLHVLSLRGNVLEHGMPRFFKRLGMGVFDEKDLAFRTHEMVAFIQSLAAKEGFNASKIIALGYSNGANIAGSTLLLYPGFLAGAILYRPMQPYQVFPAVQDAHSTPVFMSNGTQDPTIRMEDTQQYTKHLQQAGFEVSAHLLPAGHQLTGEDLRLSADWFRLHFPQ